MQGRTWPDKTLTLPELARIWFGNPLQHAVIIRNIQRERVKEAAYAG